MKFPGCPTPFYWYYNGVKARNVNSIFLGILTMLAVGAVLHLLRNLFVPLVVASLFSLMLSPLVRKMEKIRIPRVVGILVVMAILFVVLYVVGRLFYSSLITFTQVFGGYQERFTQLLRELWTRFNIPSEFFPRLGWTREVVNRVLQVTSSFVSLGASLGMFLLFLVFMLAETSLLWRKFRRAFPRSVSVKVGRAAQDIARQVARYLRVKVFISVLTGFLVWLSLSIIGQDLAALWGLLAFLLNFIPNLGSFFIMAATMTLGLLQFYPEWNRILWVWAAMTGIQVFMGNILDPQLQGDRLDLSPLVILISLVAWGWLWGFPGMFLAVPMTVAMKIGLAQFDDLRPFSIMMGSGKVSRSFRKQWRLSRKSPSRPEKP